ncbi:uncharacterized protein TEOVI_000301300 [Trypanosoma equiperdum]|uniref:Uncharacterized protein n=1 Tax=Trypanosoma equiperdum TaxID=5694 RepID=A0A1G4IGV0_TRYEQ|nr:hypothetical protein, conserved [Trypanosoma equiperdum]
MRALRGGLVKRDVERLERELKSYTEQLERERVRLDVLRARQAGRADGKSGESESDAEKRRLTRENAALRRKLAKLRSNGGSMVRHPDVADLHNQTVAVLQEVRQINMEVESLGIAHSNLTTAIVEAQADERVRDDLRSKQYNEQHALRDRLKELNEEWRAVEKRDVQLHERCAALQRQVLFNVPEKEAAALRTEYEQQEESIKCLKKRHEYLKALNYGLLGEDKLSSTKEGRAKLNAEKKLRELRQLLESREKEYDNLKGTIHASYGRSR